ncbi:MAG: response regulator [Leptolyngbyaceae cyanobacterium RU_5_1]|nr:response regulator [Leptolyngbyaceae cyanobacterium RU_5_1]
MRVLLVEDDKLTARALEKILTEQHYVVDVATDGQVGWEFVEAFTYDLILLDILLPRLDGIRFCHRLRAKDCHTPVLLLTAQSSSNDRVMGLDAGADDYVVKPFEPQELLARIRVLLRRKSSPRPMVLEWLNLRLDPGTCEVTYNNCPVYLTPKEYRLLEFFLRNHQRVFSRSAILAHLWSCEEPPGEETVTVHIKELRQKLKQSGAPADFIQTVYGQGYRLKKSTSPPSESLPLPSWVSKSLLHQRTRAGLADVWEKHQGLSRDRGLILEQACAALLEGTLTEERRQHACQTAHQLAGALGIFGFAEGSRLAGEIEQILRSRIALDHPKAMHLSELVFALSNSLHQTSPAHGYALPLLLVVDDDPELAERILELAGDWGISIDRVSSVLAAREALSAHAIRVDKQADMSYSKPNLRSTEVLLLNHSLTSEEDLMLLRELTSQTPPALVLFLTDQDSLMARVKVARLGAHVVLEKNRLKSLADSQTEPDTAPTSLPERVLEAVVRIQSQVRTTAARVMVVDDDPQILAGIRALLEPWGLQLATLAEPLQFWRMLEEFSPDLLVLDVNMPHLNGIELCQVVRTAPQWMRLPVLFFTAYTDANVLHQALSAGADDCVSKATTASDLVPRILNHLERSRLLRSMAGMVGH